MRFSRRRNAVCSWASMESSTSAIDAGGGSGRLLAAAVGERVGALVARIARMAAHPAPLDVMQIAQRVQPPPELGILHRLLVGCLPAALLPAVDPLRDA